MRVIYMPNKRLLNKSITLFNYIGENDDGKAEYSVTYLDRVAIEKTTGYSAGTVSTNAADNVILFIFDRQSVAYDKYGDRKMFLPYLKWQKSEAKEAFWTIREESQKDFWVEGIVRDTEIKKLPETYRIIRASHLQAGSTRMHHWEIVNE